MGREGEGGIHAWLSLGIREDDRQRQMLDATGACASGEARGLPAGSQQQQALPARPPKHGAAVHARQQC